MPEKPPHTRLYFDCPAPLAERVQVEAQNRGVATEEFLRSLLVTPLSDILTELHLARFDR
jgi:hypothetical protein